MAALAIAGCGSSESGSGGGSAGRAAAATGGASGAQGAGKGKHAKGIEAYVNKAPKYAKVAPSESAKSGVVKIAYRNFAIDPDTVKVKLGSTVEWVNEDPAPHNVTSEGGPMKFSSGNFGEGKTFSLKVVKTGVIHYECTLEPTTMNGTIEVVE